MKAILINPYIPLDLIYGAGNSAAGSVMPPLGIFYIASYLAGNPRHSIEVLDANLLQLHPDHVRQHVVSSNPKCVGFTSTSATFSHTVECAELLRSALPDLTIVLGGAHAQAVPEDIIEGYGEIFDYVCHGEGEYAFELLLDVLDGFSDKSGLKGFTALHDGAPCSYPSITPPDNLDVFGHPVKVVPDAWLPLYREKVMAFSQLPLFAIMGSRGCPFQCTFCSTPRKFSAIYGKRVRYHSIDWIIEEMRLLEARGVREVIFVDDTFNLDRQRVNLFCDYKIASNIRMTWSCNFEANILDFEMMKRMKSAGCWSIMIGGESGSDRMLSFIQKGVTANQLLTAGNYAYRAGLISRVSFIIGLPTETTDSIRETLDLVKKSDFHFPYFQLYVPLPGTDMYDNLSAYGQVVNSEINQHTASRVNFIPHGMTEDMLYKAYRKAYRVAYLRWGMVMRHLRQLSTLSALVRYMRGVRALGRFF